MKTAGLNNFFADIPDPRQPWKVMHKLFDIIFLTISGVIAGCDGWDEIADFGRDELDWLKNYGDFENGIPSHDTIARTLSLLDPEELQQRFIWWMRACQDVTEGSVVAIDGKTVRRSFDKSKGKSAIHMVSAFCAENRQVLGQRKTDEKENEITAIPQLLELLDVKGCLVTIDAMGCQKIIAQKIVNKEADYVLAVKANQERLLNAFQKHFPAERLFRSDSEEFDVYRTSEKGHGREETRIYFTSETFDEFVDLGLEWPELKTLGVAVSLRKEKGKEAAEIAVRYYISSAALTAVQFGKAVRAHWSIEGSLHWSLDVSMREDECRIRRGKAAENLSAVRHIAFNLLKKETTKKGGIQRKRKHAARKMEYLSKVVEAA